MIEQTVRDGVTVRFRAPAHAGQNIGPRGSDVRAGQRVLDEGTFLTPARLGVVAALGLTDATVYARPRVAILCTGNEVVEPGRPLGPGQIYDVNTEHAGGRHARARWRPGRRIRRWLTTAPQSLRRSTRRSAPTWCSIAGGSSVGERDYILEIDQREGRPSALKESRSSRANPPSSASQTARPVFGMPGNPTSCLSNAYLLVVPLLRALARLPPRADPVVICAAGAGRHLHRRAAISSILFASRAVRRCRRSKGPATSRAWRSGWLFRDSGGCRAGG